MEAATAALSLSDDGAGRFCITTAINYANGLPHMGHAYEAISADVLARYHRAFGRQVLFMTGADEHGQKIAETAALRGVAPLALCDEYVSKFQARLGTPERALPTLTSCTGAARARRGAADPLTSPCSGAEREASYQQRRVRAHHVRKAQRVLPARVSQVTGGGGHLPGLLLRLVRSPLPACLEGAEPAGPAGTMCAKRRL
jgi:tRNA synthetases class I (M)